MIASIARRIYIRGSIGVGAFKKIYGGSADRGTRPDHFAKASGAVIRHIIHQLEAAEILEKVNKDDASRYDMSLSLVLCPVHCLILVDFLSQYKVSRSGQRALDRVASSILTGKQKA
jgi:ribosomal protein S19E (S16A)